MSEKNLVFGVKAMAERKAVAMEQLAGLAIEGFVMVGRTKKGIVFEEVATGAMLELSAVAKKEDYDFAEAEAEYLEAIETASERKAKAEAKKAKDQAKKAKASE